MSLKVLLISPPFQRLKGIKNLYFPLGLGYLAAVLSMEGYDARIYNGEIPADGECSALTSNTFSLLETHQKFIEALKSDDHHVWKEINEVLESYQPDVIGLSVMTPFYGSAKKITSICKRHNPKCVVVWGGVHPTIQPQEVLETEKEVDVLVRGEGEITLMELVQALDKGDGDFKRINGLSFRHNGQIIHNESRELIKDIDELPIPARDVLINGDNLNSYDSLMLFKDLMGSRGCPYNCAYCSSCQFWGRKVRARSVGSIINEIKYLKDNFNVSNLFFWDDSFTLKRKWAIELCEAMISQKFKISWWCNTRADLINADILKMMKKAGCLSVSIGVESGSENTLSYLNRRLTVEDIRKASDMLARIGIQWDAYFMIGFPKETVDDIQKTKDLIKSLSAERATLSIFTPYPGTYLFNLCNELGLIPEKPDWTNFSHQSPENHFVKNISKEDFQKIVEETAEETDRRNHSLSLKVRRLWTMRDYYFKNPFYLVLKVYNFLKRNIVGV